MKKIILLLLLFVANCGGDALSDSQRHHITDYNGLLKYRIFKFTESVPNMYFITGKVADNIMLSNIEETQEYTLQNVSYGNLETILFYTNYNSSFKIRLIPRYDEVIVKTENYGFKRLKYFDSDEQRIADYIESERMKNTNYSEKTNIRNQTIYIPMPMPRG